MEVISLLCKNFFREQQSKLLTGKEKRQKATLVPIKCPMLTTKSMFQIMDFYAEKCGAEKTDDEYIWKLCNPFLLIIWDTGGLPRALQFMLSTCLNKLDQDFDKIFKETTITLEEYKSFVTPDECLDPNDEIRTIESLETTRIILKEKLGETFNVNYSMRWELFVAHYEAFINNMLIVCENKSEATLKELYRGAHRKYVTLNKTVKLKHLNLPEDVLVIDQTNFKKYFGHIFSPHATFYLAEDINHNFSELTKIKNIVPDVGVVTADKIVEERPYHNLDDFLDKHKHNKHQKLEES
ncbi:hypothetical protein RhiirC2_776306 [Rhizophagus irregularis]|uniref:Uncharacterized protein n=1 Tax=Rhizophagus irregularis TaxID=588596 RepID=A0A2N1NHA9_9GLOM|nr:hypothetical protein RhiirC2_776306 [Rhizophagus irregularis]